MVRWLINIPYDALEKAYQASKTVRNIQKDYLYYKNSIGNSSRRSWFNVGIYLDSVLNQSASQIYWNLLIFKVSIYFSYKVYTLFNSRTNSIENTQKNNVDYIVKNTKASFNTSIHSGLTCKSVGLVTLFFIVSIGFRTCSLKCQFIGATFLPFTQTRE